MSEEAHAAPAAEGTEAKPAKGPSKLMLPLVIALMTIAGGVVGVWFVGPRLSARASLQAGLEAEAAAAGKGDKEDGKEGAKGGEKGPVFKLDNLIVNPSGSQGARFLMVSVAVETVDGKQDEDLRARESQIRDLVISLLEKQTMESLSSPGIRDSLKAQLSDTITIIAGSKTRLHVFLPQFVIQ